MTLTSYHYFREQQVEPSFFFVFNPNNCFNSVPVNYCKLSTTLPISGIICNPEQQTEQQQSLQLGYLWTNRQIILYLLMEWVRCIQDMSSFLCMCCATDLYVHTKPKAFQMLWIYSRPPVHVPNPCVQVFQLE